MLKRIVRLAKKDDYESYYQIKSDPENVFWGGWSCPPDKEKFRFVYNARLSEDQRREYVCEVENTVVGYLAAIIYSSFVEISYGVLIKFSGQGISSEMIRHVAKEFPHKDIIAWVSKDNIGSEMCLLKNGFLKTNETQQRHLQLDEKEHTYHKWVRKSV